MVFAIITIGVTPLVNAFLLFYLRSGFSYNIVLRILINVLNTIFFIILTSLFLYTVSPSQFNHTSIYKYIFVIFIGYILFGLNSFLSAFSKKGNYIKLMILLSGFIVFLYTLYYFIIFLLSDVDSDSIGFDSIVPAPTINFIANLIFPIIIIYIFIRKLMKS